MDIQRRVTYAASAAPAIQRASVTSVNKLLGMRQTRQRWIDAARMTRRCPSDSRTSKRLVAVRGSGARGGVSGVCAGEDQGDTETELVGGAEMWQIKLFRFKTTSDSVRAKDAMRQWLAARAESIQYVEIFVNNAYGVEWRPLRRIG